MSRQPWQSLVDDYPRGNRGRERGESRGRPQCIYCGRLGHREEKCYAKHGRPAVMANASLDDSAVSVSGSANPSVNQTVSISQGDFEQFQ